MKLQTYGLDLSAFPKATQLEVELLMVKDPDPSRFSGLSRGQHIKHVIHMLWPWVMDGWNDWSELCLWAWTNYKEIGTTGCGAAGKTFTFSLISTIEYLACPMATRVALTSTTVPSLRGRVWSEVMNFMRPVHPLFGLNVVDSQTKIQFQKGDDRHSIIGLAVDSGAVEQAVGKLQGFHPSRTIICVDEAPQSPPAVFDARFNLSIGADFYRFVAIGNASSQYDAHGRFCEPKGGWSTITADYESWETKTGICIHFDGLKSPNVKRGKIIFPKLFSQEDIDACRANYGENSLQWWSYVRGFWPPSGVRNTVVDAATIQEGRATDKAIWAGGGLMQVAALDPAFTTDGDDCVLRFGMIGKTIDGDTILMITETHKIIIEERVDYPAFFQIADRVIEKLLQKNIQPECFALDSTGGGAGLADIIGQRWKNGFHRVTFGGYATEDKVSVEDEKTGKELYYNRVTQLWFNVRQMIVGGKLRGLDEDTARELSTRLYSLKKEKICVESKKEMKARTSGNSPDRADALALLVEVFVRNYGIQGTNATNQQMEEDWDSFVSQNTLESTYD